MPSWPSEVHRRELAFVLNSFNHLLMVSSLKRGFVRKRLCCESTSSERINSSRALRKFLTCKKKDIRFRDWKEVGFFTQIDSASVPLMNSSSSLPIEHPKFRSTSSRSISFQPSSLKIICHGGIGNRGIGETSNNWIRNSCNCLLVVAIMSLSLSQNQSNSPGEISTLTSIPRSNVFNSGRKVPSVVRTLNNFSNKNRGNNVTRRFERVFGNRRNTVRDWVAATCGGAGVGFA